MSKKAQDMIAKGIETGDMELIKAGHALLKEAEDKKKVVKKKAAKKTVKKTVKKKATKKKAAPKKKTARKTLTKAPAEPIVTNTDPDAQFRMQLRNPTNSRMREDGKMLMRTEKVDLSKIGKSNSYVDDGKIAPRRKQEKGLYVVEPVERRPESKMVNANCVICGTNRFISSKLLVGGIWKCDACLIRLGRTRG